MDLDIFDPPKRCSGSGDDSPGLTTQRLSDYDLRHNVLPPTHWQWTEDWAKETFERIKKATNYTDDSIAGMMTLGAESTYAFMHPKGHLGGVAIFAPVVFGHSAYVHIYIWDGLFLGRRDLHRAGLRDAIRRWGLVRVGCTTPAGNTLAAKLAQDLGFTQEGVMRRGICYDEGEAVDAICWSVLPEEL